jgi:menaquinone reductase, multiheme cytochrome c subunit
MASFAFPPWTNRIRVLLGVAIGGGLVYLITFVAYGFSPKTTDVGYAPPQPVPYSHAVHAGRLGIDCRYCHSTVEQAAMAAIPAAATCMNCHKAIRATSPSLLMVRQSAAGDSAVPWVHVHDLPNYAYFDHSAHVRRGVGCVSCHDRVDKMERVTWSQPLNMAWCLACHRAPDAELRPVAFVTTMDWQPNEPRELAGAQVRLANNLNPPTDCNTCHR